MTALWPYYLTPPDPDSSLCVVSFNGLGFDSLMASMQVVERVLAGKLEWTRESCAYGVARVLCTATGVIVSEKERAA